MYMCVYTYTYTCTYTYKYIYIYRYIHIHMHIHMCTYTCVYTLYIYIYIYTYVCMHIHIYIWHEYTQMIFTALLHQGPCLPGMVQWAAYAWASSTTCSLTRWRRSCCAHSSSLKSPYVDLIRKKAVSQVKSRRPD